MGSGSLVVTGEDGIVGITGFMVTGGCSNTCVGDGASGMGARGSCCEKGLDCSGVTGVEVDSFTDRLRSASFDTIFPQLKQKIASSELLAPQFLQNIDFYLQIDWTINFP